MQVLKDEMKNRIYEAAVAEFRENGYKNSSMRSIARMSGMTAGNLYRYFKNKDELFYAVVNPVYEIIVRMINCRSHEAKDDDFRAALIDDLVKVFSVYRNELLILIEGSEGTVYENVSETVIEMFENHIKLCEVFKSKVFFAQVNVNEFLYSIIAQSFIEGLKKVLIQFDNEKELKAALELVFDYCFNKIEDRFG